MKVTDLANDLGNNLPGALKGISDTVAQRVDALEVIIKRYALEANASAALSKAQADRIASLDTAVADRMAAIDARLQGALALPSKLPRPTSTPGRRYGPRTSRS